MKTNNVKHMFQESIRIQRENESTPSRDGPSISHQVSRWGKRRRAETMWKTSEKKNGSHQDGELWAFLFPHIRPILSGKG